jgi:intein-encoded DNA endonuclease-like protein
LHQEGKNALEISKILGFKYSQPVYNYFKKQGWDRLDRSDYKYNTTYTVNQEFFDEINTEEKAYILGFVCADGHVDAKAHRLTIALKDSDYKILESIRQVMESTHPIKRHIKKRNPYTKANNLVLEQCSLSINGKRLVSSLVDMGIAGKKTYTLDSSIVKHIPQKHIRHFLRGYLDGDGCITWRKKYNSGAKYIVQVVGNQEFLLEAFQRNFPSNCSLYKDKTSKQCYVWKIANKRSVLEFLNYLYKDAKIYLDRKYKIYQFAMWSCKTELIAGNSYFMNLIKGQSAAKPLVKCLRKVQRLADETILNPYEEGSVEYNSATNAQHLELQNSPDEDIVRTA